MRPAKSERHSESLGVAHGDVGAPFRRGREQREGEQVGGDGDKALHGMDPLHHPPVIDDGAQRIRILNQAARHAGTEGEVRHIGDDHLHAARLGPCRHDRDGLRVTMPVHHVNRTIVRGRRAQRQRHRFRRRGAFIEERGVGDLKAGEIRDHRLEVEQRFEPTLRDLRLIGCVGGVPAGILEDVALDDPRHEAVVISEAKVGSEHLILLGHRPERREGFLLGARRRERERLPEPDGFRHDGIDEGVEARVAQHLEHRGHVGLAGAEVTGDKGTEPGVRQSGSHIRRMPRQMKRSETAMPRQPWSGASTTRCTATAAVRRRFGPGRPRRAAGPRGRPDRRP